MPGTRRQRIDSRSPSRIDSAKNVDGKYGINYHSSSCLDAHLPARDDGGDDVLGGRVGVDAVRPLVDGDDVAALLVRVGRLPRLVDEGATRQPGHLMKIGYSDNIGKLSLHFLI